VKLTVLGGSPAGPNTGAGCSGYLVDSGNTRVVLDLGPGTLPELRRHTDFRTLDGIVVSHMHLDHMLDLAALRFALAYNPIKPPARVPLWLPPRGCAHLAQIARAFADEGADAEFFTSVFRLGEYDPAQGIAVGDIAVSFSPTIHFIPCWAMRLDLPGDTVLGYTADTGPAAPLSSFFAGVDVLISEATLAEPGDDPIDRRGHLTAAEAASLAERVGARTLVLSHLWEELGLERARSAAAAVFSGDLVVARPGTVVEW
jgi:ribonuclease BN (tRNA processing enzyme)